MKIWKQMRRYILVGIVAVSIELSVLYTLVEYLSFYYILAALFGYGAAVGVGFFLNKIWTFNDTHKDIKKQFVLYTALRIGCGLLSLTTLIILVEFFSVWYIFAQTMGVLLAGSVNFILNKLVIFS